MGLGEFSDERVRDAERSSKVTRNSPWAMLADTVVLTAPYSALMVVVASRSPQHGQQATRWRASASTRRNASRNSRLKML